MPAMPKALVCILAAPLPMQLPAKDPGKQHRMVSGSLALVWGLLALAWPRLLTVAVRESEPAHGRSLFPSLSPCEYVSLSLILTSKWINLQNSEENYRTHQWAHVVATRNCQSRQHPNTNKWKQNCNVYRGVNVVLVSKEQNDEIILIASAGGMAG